MNKNEKNLSGYGFSFKDYIRILENPDKIGLNNGIWSAPILKGYDKNQRGYGIDINTNKKAKALTNNRPGRWLTEKEADTLMDDHINYITEAANKHIKGFSELPFRRRWALLGMLYRGDSVNKSGININEPDDLKFFKSISNYYRSKGLNARANSSDEFFNRPISKLLSMFKLKNGGYIRKMQTAAGGPLINESTRVEKPIIAIPKKINKSQLLDDNLWEKTDNNNEVNVYPNLRNDKYVQEFFLYDYAPRFKRLNNFASQDYVNAALNIYKNTPINIYNEDSNIGGYQTGGEREIYNNYFSNLINSTHVSPSIYLNEKFKMNRPNLVHELTHAFRLGHLGITGDARFSSVKRPLYNAINKEIGNKYSGSGYSNSEKNILNNTYNMAGYKINYDPLLEKGTTNTEVRFRLWKELYDKLGRRPSLEETDRYIRTYNGEKLLKIIRNANAYGQTMYNNGMLIDLVKNALINVAQNNSNNAYLLNDQTYYAKQGGRIRKMLTASGGPIHYSRTMDTDNLSKAANYVGKYVLKGLGAFGRFLNAGFTSPTYGTVGQVSYARNAKDAKRLRKQSEASEQAMGKAMTWISPLNYGAALWNGHGLNARKGEEEVASWSPAWQAIGRLGELYVGPKAVKGVKSAPRVVVNTAAKAGVKPAKAAVVAREIKLATKNAKLNNNSTVIPHEDLFDFWHGGLESDFNFGNLDVFRKASKQSKRNRNYAGFYMYSTPRLLGAFNYGFGEAHGIKLKPDAKKLKVNFNTERIEALELLNYRNQGYDYIEGKDVWGAPEYILLNKDAIQHTGFFDHSLGHNLHILRDRNIPKVDLSINNLPSKTSLAFFERPTLSNAQELAGATKWERNFKPKWHVANYPGYLLKGLMKGSLLEKQLSKNGTININLLNAYFNKASQIEKEIANKVLAEKFSGLKIIDYNLFKKAVLDELIGSYNRVPLTKYADYGIERLGYNLKTIGENELPGLPDLIILGEPVHYTPPGTKADPINLSTFTFESPRISLGSAKHYDTSTLGHSRTYITPDEPKVLHVMESQSDWGQKKYFDNIPTSLNNSLRTIHENNALLRFERLVPTQFKEEYSRFLKDRNTYGNELPNDVIDSYSEAFKEFVEDRLGPKISEPNKDVIYRWAKKYFDDSQVKYLHNNYLQRLLQENLKYAAENGLTKMRYPTSETAAKIEGYLKVNHTLLNELSNYQMKLGELFENGEISWEEYDRMIDAINKLKKELFGKEYSPEHQTILKKYADFPKLFLKLFKDLQVRTVTDAKGNTWYEVDVPKGYLSREWLFKQGGQIRKMQTAAGGNLFSSKKNHRGKIVTTGGAGYVPLVNDNNVKKLNNYILKGSRALMTYIQNTDCSGFINPFTYDWKKEANNDENGDSYRGPAQDTFLTPRHIQEKEFLRRGYIKGKKDDYGLVRKAVNGRNFPIYQRSPDAISRDKLIVLGNTYYSMLDYDKGLEHENSAPTAVYTDGHGNFYQKQWDLNDYGGDGGATSGIAGKILDFIGNPVVVTTGFQKIKDHPHLIGNLTPMMAKKGLVPTDIDGKTKWTLPEIIVTGKKK